jgi:photosystem II stability/assembly factor-like uncharacterized protein
MLTPTTGWSMAGGQVLWTIDGGTHWRNITPPSLQHVVGFLQASFLNESVGWVWAFQDTTTSLFSTTDGGQTWQQGASFQSRSYVTLSFLTPQDGWALADRPDSQDETGVDLWRTRDGGMTWAMLATTGTAARPGSIPAAGRKGGVSFLNASTGWIGGLHVPEAALNVTHDGGLTWQAQPLPFQQDGSQRYFYVGTPGFFNDHEGLLWVSVLNGSDVALCQLVYLTHDGGTSWQSIPPLANDALYSFSDARHGWMLDIKWVNGGSSLQTTLSTTSDGGQHWNALPGGAAVEGIFQLDFLSSTLGWAISRPAYGTTVLLKTDDGGQSWTQITPVLL